MVLDTKGFELFVLKGALSSLKQLHYISTEVANFESYKDCCTLVDITKFTKEHQIEEVERSKFAERTNGEVYYDVFFK